MVFQEYPITLAANNIVLFTAIAIYPWSNRPGSTVPYANTSYNTTEMKRLTN